MVTLLGVPAGQRETLIELTQRRLGWRYRLVYVTDDPDFLPLRRHKASFEYLPSLAEQRRHRPEAPWAEFLEQRRSLLIAKWRPKHIVAYGLPFTAFLTQAVRDAACSPAAKA